MSKTGKNYTVFIYKYFKHNFYVSSIFLILIFSYINNVLCSDNDSKGGTKSIIILILLIVAFVIIFALIILFIVCFCCKKKRENRNNYLEGSTAFEIGNQKEVDLRDKIANEGIKALSNYLRDELIIDIYDKKFELFMKKCPICLENLIENKSNIILSGCLHIFHEKCLSTFAEKIDLNKNIFPQFICPVCKNNLFDGIDKIKTCLEIDPNFFDDIYKNKKITKMKHVKSLIDKMINENMKKQIKNDNSKVKIENLEDKKIENENENDNDYKDISFDDIVIPINKSKIIKRNSNEIRKSKSEVINYNDIDNPN